MSYDMVYDAKAANYSQSGTYFGYGQSCVHKFTEQDHNGSYSRLYFGCTAIGERHSYRNLIVGQPRRMVAYIDSVPEQSTSYDPIASWAYPYDVQFMGKTKYLQSDVFGVPTRRQEFTGMGVQRYDNDQLVTTCGHVILGRYHNIPARYATAAVDCSHVQTWTHDV